MKMSIIVPYSNQDPRREEGLNHLFNSIDKQDLRVVVNNKATEQRDWEFIFVEHDTGGDYKRFDARGIPDQHIILKYESKYNKAWCMNVAARHSRTDWLVFCDADMLFGKEYLYKVNLWRTKTIPRDPFFIGWDSLMKLPGKSEHIARTLDPTAALTAGGIFWVHKNFFWQVGGMNENYFGYGGEDNDFWIRVNVTLGGASTINVRRAPYALVHSYHDDAEPSPERFYHLDRVHQHPQEIIKKLKSVDHLLGNTSTPTKVSVDDLLLSKPGIQDPNSKGIVA
jgi:glycosyltransferase involved in cell wall biosynthesis